jgi:hypothetical protein
MKYLTTIGAWLMVMASLSGCSAEVDESAPEGELATSSEEIKNWGGTKPGSCLDKCLTLCPKDGNGGIEAGCLLTCFSVCANHIGAATTATLAK